jgi:hypothetical protein
MAAVKFPVEALGTAISDKRPLTDQKEWELATGMANDRMDRGLCRDFILKFNPPRVQ